CSAIPHCACCPSVDFQACQSESSGAEGLARLHKYSSTNWGKEPSGSLLTPKWIRSEVSGRHAIGREQRSARSQRSSLNASWCRNPAHWKQGRGTPTRLQTFLRYPGHLFRVGSFG